MHQRKNRDNKNIDFTMSFSLNLRITDVATNLRSTLEILPNLNKR